MSTNARQPLPSEESNIIPIVGNSSIYHKSQIAIDELLIDLEEYSGLFTSQHKVRLSRLAGGGTELETMTIDHVQKQFQLVNKIRDRLLDKDDNLLEGFDTKGISLLVSSINSLTNLFLRSQEKINHLEEIAHLKEAVLGAVSTLSKTQQTEFFNKFDELTARRKHGR